MANANLKKDFKDGDKLFAQQLNNNFAAIEAALAMMNKIVWQGDDDADAVVTFRGTTEELEEREIINGQLLYNVDTGETYIDFNGVRISTGSGNAIHIGASTPENPSTQLWIDPTEILQNFGSEVVNSLSGDETNRAPSVHAAKELFIPVSGFNENGSYIKYPEGTLICYGQVEVTANAASATKTLPVNFVNSLYIIIITNSYNYYTDLIWSSSDQNASSFKAWVQDSNGGTPAQQSIGYWVAIGRWK